MSSNRLNSIAESEAEVVAVQEEAPVAVAPDPAPQATPRPSQPGRWSSWKDIVERISYQGIVRNMPYLMFLTLLCILYITNNNRAISLTRNINSKSKELKELRWRYMDIQSRLMYQTSETQLIPKAAAIGLKPLDKPAFEIRVKVPATTEKED
ncbi:FtsL-like putative cell division protein [Taibaiella koreensis]|uniref:FtsL-like putative cell division protein n=1 Tax=Taibaiella koreensis TaxID=1268548 RepID=UPI000E5A0513|nr:FtsL-like putative cell division protein [Taibaiella koreensis]